MYTPRSLFSELLFVKICLFVHPLYTVGRQVPLPCEISFQSPSLQIRVQGQSMACVHTRSELDNEFQRYGHIEFDPTGNGAVRSAVPENPALEPNMKGIGCRLRELWPFEIFPICVNWP